MAIAVQLAPLDVPQVLHSFPSLELLTSPVLSRFVQFAATTLSAEGSFLLINCDNSLHEAHRFGPERHPPYASWDFVSACDLPRLENLSYPIHTHVHDDRSLLVTIAIRRGTRFLAVLGVYDPHPGSLSAAQEYVLQAVACEIADQLEVEDLSRPHPVVAESSMGDHLLARLRLLESVVVNASDSVVITEAEPIDLPGPRIQYVNPAFTRATGYTHDDVIGRSPRLLQGPLSGPEAPARIKAALKAWKPVEVELLNYRKDGSTFWVELSISPVCDEKGWYTHWVSVQRDVTERKANEEVVALLRATGLHNVALTEEIRERKLIEAKLSHVAFHDDLTGIRNRSYFMECLRHTLTQVQSRQDYRAAIIYLDLNGFKSINDTLGHRVGDLLLTEIAQRVKRYARVQDTAARLGGDEFTLLIDDLQHIDQALEIGQRLIHAISAPVLLAGMMLQVTASIGLCEVDPVYGDAEEVLRDADTAMYRAKRQGGARCVLFDRATHVSPSVDLQIRSQLTVALENDELELFYQPLVNMLDLSIYGVEALIRWNHPVRGLVSPAEFIPLSEEMGLIVDIGAWVLRRACADFTIMQQASRQALCLSVNVSSRQFEEASFLDDLKATLKASGIAPHLLQLEITESVLLKNAERVGILFQQVRALGIKIAFDDFGTGYSSLSYVERYPIDTLKIDQSFVQNMIHNTVNTDIVQLIIRLAQRSGMGVSAEGVETEEQAATLCGYGCAVAQGYLYSRPLSLHALTKLLLQGIRL